MVEPKRTPVRAWVVILSLSAATFIAFMVLLLLGVLRIPPMDVVSADETLILYLLTAFNFVAFSVFAFILARNLLRLMRERRARQLGSHLKARLVRYFILISILPLVFLAMFSYLVINRTLEKWFGEPYRNIVRESEKLARAYVEDEVADLRATLDRMERQLAVGEARSRERAIAAELEHPKVREITLIQGTQPRTWTKPGFVRSPHLEEAFAAAIDAVRAERSYEAFPVEGDEARFVVLGRPIGASSEGANVTGIILLAEVPQQIARVMAALSRQQEAYEQLHRRQGQTRRVTLQVLGVITFLLLFAATWTGMYLAKGITEPIQALAEATQHVARGDFSRPVVCVAEDELAMLVDSFNRMIAELSENRRRLEASARELQAMNLALEERRRYIETVLESLSTGVISFEESGRITTVNRAAREMLRLSDPLPAETAVDLFRSVFGEAQAAIVEGVIARASTEGWAVQEIDWPTPMGQRHLILTASPLWDPEGAMRGAVLMLEDVTELVQAQRQAVWSEVARRMAHEIKNPLTPIRLSAERIAKHLLGDPKALAEERYRRIVREGTAIIQSEVQTLQRLVNEFAQFARLPEARLVEGEINDAIRAALQLYDERPEGIVLEADLAPDVPRLRFDAEQLKRALVNLIENAVEALDGVPGEKRITVSTRYMPERGRVRVSVADTGPGIAPSVRERLFTPYFSNKAKGMGLGLAIVRQIIAEHGGTIWVEENEPRGARFVIELPVLDRSSSSLWPTRS
ncbi:MAG: ATP-binding protein [Acidobacteriota bacterium]|nr:ATP-binding protein [Acidobacteriota bacterium]